MKRFFEQLYKGSKDLFFSDLEKRLENEEKTFIVTANPETFMLGKKDKELESILLDKGVISVADGIGIVKGAERIGTHVEERIPGIEIAEKLLSLGNSLKKTVFLFGAEQKVVDKLETICEKEYPDLRISGAVNGYVEDKDSVFGQIREKSPDVVLVALGIPLQEKLIYRHLSEFDKGIFVGVGGSFDVISGEKKRAPDFFIKHNLEWFYRLVKEPSRIKRFYNNNVKFFVNLKK